MALEHGAVNKGILIERFNMGVIQLLYYTFALGITCYIFGLWKGQEIERKALKMRKYVYCPVFDGCYDINDCVDDISSLIDMCLDTSIDEIAILDALSLEYCGCLQIE